MSDRENRLKKEFDKWCGDKANVQDIASSLYSASTGDARKLLCSYKKADGVFGVASQNLFQENTEIDRWLLYNIWHNDKHGVRALYAAICGVQGRKKRFKPVKFFESEDAYCWCKTIPANTDPTSILCSVCKKKYHKICCGLTSSEALGVSDFICLRCKGSPAVPPLFRTPIGLRGDVEADNATPASRKTEERRSGGGLLSRLMSRASSVASLDRGGLEKLNSVRRQLIPASPTTRETTQVQQNLDLSVASDQELSTPQQLPQNFPEQPQREIDSPRADSPGLEITEADFEDPFTEEGTGVDVNIRETSPSACDDPTVSDHDRSRNGSVSSGESIEFLSQTGPCAPIVDRKPAVITTDLQRTSPVCLADDPEDLDTSCVPTSFTVFASGEQWRTIVAESTEEAEDGSGTYMQWYKSCSEDYGDVLQELFSQQNKCCVLTFSKSVFRKPWESSRAFLRVYGTCLGSRCKAKYAFTVQQVHNLAANRVPFIVRKTSNAPLSHFRSERIKRPLRGKTRKEYQKRLVHEKPSRTQKDMYANADKQQLDWGNYNLVKNLKTLQQARTEALQADDESTDVLVDLFMTKIKHDNEFKHPKFPGYLQHISVFPFWVTLLCSEQLRILKAAMRRNMRPTLFFDSTGSICQPLPQPLPQTQIQYYIMVVKGMQAGEPPIPIFEFYSGSHNVATIEFQLRFFLEKFKDTCGVTGRNYGIGRVEVDFAKAMLAAVCHSFNHGNLDDYLWHLYEALSTDTDLDPYFVAVHVCRFHVQTFWTEKVKKLVQSQWKTPNGKPRKPTAAEAKFVEMLDVWINSFVTASSLQDLVTRIKEILALVGSKFNSSELEQIILHWGNFGTQEVDTEAYLPVRDETIQLFYKRSPFGQIAQQIIEEIRTENARLENLVEQQQLQLQPNPCANAPLMGYLLIHILPYAPLLTHCIFTAHNIAVEDDTNNYAELSIRQLKRDYLQELRFSPGGIKASRLVRLHTQLAKGATTQGLASAGVLMEPVGDHGGSDIEDEFAREPDEFISPDLDVSRWGPRTQRNTEVEKRSSGPPRMPLIQWGGKVKVRGKSYTLTNTCPIDCTMQILYYLDNFTAKGKQFIMSKNDELGRKVRDMINYIKVNNINDARVMWIEEILGEKIGNKKRDRWDEERVVGVGGISPWLTYISKTTICSTRGCPGNNKLEKGVSAVKEYPVTTEMFLSWFREGMSSVCDICRSRDANVIYKFNNEAPDVLVYVLNSRWTDADGQLTNNEPEKNLKRKQVLSGVEYKVVAYTLYTGSHFYAVFWNEEGRWTYDGTANPLQLNQRKQLLDDSVHNVWLVRD